MGDTMLYLLDSLMQSKEKIVLKWEQIIKSEFNGTFVESTATHCWPALRTCLSTKTSVRPSGPAFHYSSFADNYYGKTPKCGAQCGVLGVREFRNSITFQLRPRCLHWPPPQQRECSPTCLIGNLCFTANWQRSQLKSQTLYEGVEL